MGTARAIARVGHEPAALGVDAFTAAIAGMAAALLAGSALVGCMQCMMETRQ